VTKRQARKIVNRTLGHDGHRYSKVQRLKAWKLVVRRGTLTIKSRYEIRARGSE
jgi:hypothetical protein